MIGFSDTRAVRSLWLLPMLAAWLLAVVVASLARRQRSCAAGLAGHVVVQAGLG